MRISSQSLGVVHFVGIGGIGMSGVAEILNSLGYGVRGSDLSENKNVTRLRGLGISIVIGQKAENIQGAGVVVISSAITDDNEELQAARKAQIPVVKRADMLAEIMRMRPCISVAGTHGKTTTTSIAATVLDEGGMDPTVISGGIINAYGTNARLGSGAWMVVEADESDGTFSRLPATIAVVTNIEPEHMNHYGSFEALKSAFQTYIEHIPFYGLGILCGDQHVTREIAATIQDRRVVTYGIDFKDAGIRAINIKAQNGGYSFDVLVSDHARQLFKSVDLHETLLTNFTLPMMGHHNILNALSVIACGLELGLTLSQIKSGLGRFQGVERRFSILGTLDGRTIVDDYAHHPTEIKATLSAARELAGVNRRLVAFVQPHRYSRLADLFTEFTTCFTDADRVVVLPVYAAGEMPNLTATHLTLVSALQNAGIQAHGFSDKDELYQIVKSHTEKEDICVFMGAGDISSHCHAMFKKQGGISLAHAIKKEKKSETKIIHKNGNQNQNVVKQPPLHYAQE